MKTQFYGGIFTPKCFYCAEHNQKKPWKKMEVQYTEQHSMANSLSAMQSVTYAVLFKAFR